MQTAKQIMNTEQFWHKASDIHDLYRGLYRRAVLTDDEKLRTVEDFITDMESLIREWRSQNNSSEENR